MEHLSQKSGRLCLANVIEAARSFKEGAIQSKCIMTDEPDYFNEETEGKSSTGTKLNKAIAILFVAAIYLVIFLKILFIE